MDKYILLPIIFVVGLLTVGMVLSTNELTSKNSTDDMAQNNSDAPSVDIEDTNKIIRGDYIDNNPSSNFDNPYFDYYHDCVINSAWMN